MRHSGDGDFEKLTLRKPWDGEVNGDLDRVRERRFVSVNGYGNRPVEPAYDAD
jgi:hypothetical protein